MSPRLLRRAARSVLFGVVLAACSGEPQTSGGAVCTFGQIVPCKGANQCEGESSCLPDLSRYGPCDCGDAGAGEAGADATAMD